MIKVNKEKMEIVGTEEDLIIEFKIILVTLKSMGVINSKEELEHIIDISEEEEVKEMYNKI